MADNCTECGRWTQEGERKRREASKLKPIFGTDFAKPLSETIEGLRRQIAQIRGNLSDIDYAYPAWGERVKCVEGALTCCLVSLHDTREEMKRFELEQLRDGGDSPR